MKIGELILILQRIQVQFGDYEIDSCLVEDGQKSDETFFKVFYDKKSKEKRVAIGDENE